jgi:CDP-glycerol glycerophosphotransferase (TagB/SpsB family)
MGIIARVGKILDFFPLSKTIVLESIPDFACNTYPVYQKLREALPSHSFVWLVHKRTKNSLPGSKAVYTGKDRTFWEFFLHQWYLSRCCVMISSNGFECKRTRKQLFLFLTHGSKTKKTRGMYEMGDLVDFINVQSHFFDDIIAYEYNCRKEQLVYLGYPRCDFFFSRKRPDVRALTQTASDEKYVIWLPTFRATKAGRIDAQSETYGNIGMPIVYSLDKLNELNSFLAGIRLHILFKPHPAQDMSSVKTAKLSNFHLISDDDVAKAGLQLYEAIAGSEALITDYSSVFFDYLLLDHPIATTTDDIESWKSGRGFAFDIEKMYDRATVRVKDQDELTSFLKSVSDGADEKASGRREVRDITNMHVDGNSAERVAGFICDFLGEKRRPARG